MGNPARESAYQGTSGPTVGVRKYFAEYKELFTELLGGDFSTQDIAKMAMEEALKKAEGTRAAGGATPSVGGIPHRQPYPPAPSTQRAPFTMTQAGVHVPAHVVKLFKA